MSEKYTKEQLWKLYKKLPQELRETVFSGETADNVYDICEKNGIENISQLTRYVQDVLLGILSTAEFEETIKKELKLTKQAAKKVTQQINRFIFYPVRPLLEELYRIEIIPTIQEKPSLTIEAPIPEEKKSAPPKKDTYREPTY